MNKLYTQLHTANNFYQKQFFKASLFLLLIVAKAKNVNAQCEANPVANQTVCNNTATAAINFTGTVLLTASDTFNETLCLVLVTALKIKRLSLVME